jgi:hypothetical protein
MRRRVRTVLTAIAAVVSVALATVGLGGTADAATATGTLAVLVTDSVGGPLGGAIVAATSDGTTWHQTGLSQPAGTYQLKLAPGGYRIRITAANGAIVDFVPGLPTIDGAATFQVVADQTTTVNEQLTQSGNVQVSLVDRVTGQPVTDGCVTIGYRPSSPICNHPDGRYLFVAVPLGSQTFTVSATWTHWTPDPVQVTVASGFVDVPVRLDPAAAIQTSVQASDDPSIHPDFCVLPVYPGAAGVQFYCDDTTTGTVHIGPLPTTSVQLFAMSVDDLPGSTSVPVYGAQWVGAHGGTGDQREAQRFGLTEGTVTTVPPIQLDHAGSISGVVGPGNNQVTNEYYVQPFGLQPGLGFGWGLGAGIAVAALMGGPYTLTGLGPYAWPVEFSGRAGFADQWSGNAPDRYAATLVQVKAGQTSVLNATMVPGESVTGFYYVTPPTTDYQGWVYAVNSVTGDETGFDLGGTNTFQIYGLNSEPVRLKYQLYATGDRWYDYPLTVPTSGPVSTAVVLTRAAPWPKGGTTASPPYGRRNPGPTGPPMSPSFAAPDAPSLATVPDAPLSSAAATVPRRRSAKPWFF